MAVKMVHYKKARIHYLPPGGRGHAAPPATAAG
jgi:hypothetical protein